MSPSSPALSLASLSSRRNFAVPELAIVPMSCPTSSYDIPMPLSRTVSVRASLSMSISMCGSDTSASSESSQSFSRRSLSSASEALETSSRRKTSLFE